MKVTLSVIKADIGGYVGHSSSHPDILQTAREGISGAKKRGLVMDYHVTRCGDDLQLIITHKHGINHGDIHEMAWNIFVDCTQVPKKLKTRFKEID